jgi:hypothetical protein
MTERRRIMGKMSKIDTESWEMTGDDERWISLEAWDVGWLIAW